MTLRGPWACYVRPVRQWLSRLSHKVLQRKKRHLLLVMVILASTLILALLLFFRCDPHGFQVRLDHHEKELLLEALDVLTNALTTANVSFLMYRGTLLGSWRHHGMIPWDDEVDVMVSVKLKKNVSDLLHRLKPHYLLIEDQEFRWKFYSSRAVPIGGKTWSFPSVDVCFYVLNSSHFWGLDTKNGAEHNHRKEFIFPLTLRPFEGRQLPMPHDMVATLTDLYSHLDMCHPSSFSHREERSLRPCTPVHCSQLKGRYAFVRRRRAVTGRGCEEMVVRNGTVASWVILPDLKC